MRQKDVFLSLQSRDRGRMRIFLSALAVFQVVEFSMVRPFGVGAAGGILGNLAIVYWCAFPRKALNWFFALIPSLCLIGFLFDGLAVLRAASDGGVLTGSMSLSLARLAVLCLLTPSLLRFRRVAIASEANGSLRPQASPAPPDS